MVTEVGDIVDEEDMVVGKGTTAGGIKALHLVHVPLLIIIINIPSY